MKKRYKKIKCMLALFMAVTLSIPVNISAKPLTDSAITLQSKDYTLGREMTQEEIEKQKANEPHLADIELDTSISPQIYGDIGFLTEEPAPSSYSSVDEGYITSVKDQNPYGTCWAFTTVACAEANILKKTGKEYDLSELHLAYHNYNTVEDELGLTKGDGVKYNALVSYLDCGGNYILTPAVLTKGFGFALEENSPYSLNTNYAPTKEQSNERAVVLDNSILINNSDTATIKSSIMKYGAVATMYYHDANYLNYDTSAYYNYETKKANHGVTIVGWDDDYSKANFGFASNTNSMPSNNGAWLVKNSWGTTGGKQGYFWLSYEDVSFTTPGIVLCAFDCSIPDYDNIYQYDGGHTNAYCNFDNGETICVYYTVQGKESTYERLDSICFGTDTVGYEYSVQIYKDSTEENLLDGIPMLDKPLEGYTDHQGYYSIELPDNILFEQGDTYTVAITFTSDVISKFNMYCDISSESSPCDYVASMENDKIYWINKYKQIYSAAQLNTTIRLKARTENVKTASNIDFSFKEKEMDISLNSSKSIEYTINPEEEAANIEWFSSDEKVAVVNNGVVEGKGKGSAVITAVVDGQRKSLNVRVCETVELTSDMFELEYTLTEYTGNPLKPSVITGIESSCYSVEYSNNINPGTAVVTISAKDVIINYLKYTGSCTLNFTIKSNTDNDNKVDNDNKNDTGNDNKVDNDNKNDTDNDNKVDNDNKNDTDNDNKVDNDNKNDTDNDNKVDNDNKNDTDNNVNTDNENKEYTVTLNAESIPLQLNKSTTAVKATLMAGDKIKSWSSSNKKIATVSKKGKIKAKRVGTAKITVTTEQGAKATVVVKVTKKKVVTKKITVNKTKVNLAKGETFKIIVTKNPITANEKIKYTSSNKKVATVTSKGVIKANKKGKAKITIKSANGKKKVVTVTVKESI